ncbi:MAG TPA: ABC transporter permease subunit [Solirubrobacteraceae bacterium]|nr:ABC transporter permease subunit [Solirubrobacteraceae bacterium]
MLRIRSVIRKEMRDYRRNRFIFASMAIYPVIFIALPMANIFAIPASITTAALERRLGAALLFMLLVPVIVPATIAAYAVVGEREQGALEPLLTTPILGEELLIGKAVAAAIPSITIAYAAFGAFLASVKLFANANVATAIFHQHSVLIAQVVFTPLLAGFAIWVGIAISARSSDLRIAQQLSILASLPVLALTSLMTFGIIRPTLGLVVAFAAGLLVIDSLGWRAVAAIFDRERLVTGRKPATSTGRHRRTWPAR